MCVFVLMSTGDNTCSLSLTGLIYSFRLEKHEKPSPLPSVYCLLLFSTFRMIYWGKHIHETLINKWNWWGLCIALKLIKYLCCSLKLHSIAAAQQLWYWSRQTAVLIIFSLETTVELIILAVALSAAVISDDSEHPKVFSASLWALECKLHRPWKPMKRSWHTVTC